MGMSAITELHGSGVRENEPLTRSGPGRPDAVETEMTALKEEKKDFVAEAAKAAFDAANGDVQIATKAFEQTVRGNRDLRDQLLDPLVSTACYDAIRRVCHQERRQVWKAPVHQPAVYRGSDAARVVQLAAGNLLMFPLPGGKKLGEASRQEISDAAGFYAQQAGDMAHKARWLQLIAQSVPADKTVGDVMTDERLRELQAEARDV